MSELPPALRYASPVELSERLQAERRGRPFLLFRDGDGRQRIVELDGSRELSVGRDASNDVALEWDSEVSRAHALLQRIGGAWTLVDDGRDQRDPALRLRSFFGDPDLHPERLKSRGSLTE